ncbi:MAG: carbohydrate kinase [Pseudomonadota bacterium]
MLFGEVLADMFPGQNVLGGAPFNVARHLKAFGQNPVLLSRLGDDDLGDEVLRVMSQNGMETLGIQNDRRYPTGRVLVHVKDGAHRFEILPTQAYDFIDPDEARSAALSGHPSLIYFGTLAQRQEVSSRALKSLLQSVAGLKFLDINMRSPWYDERILRQSLHSADIVKLNIDELTELTGMFGLSGDTPQGNGRELMDKFNILRVVVTCGAEGAWQVTRNGRAIEVGVKSKIANLVDTVGAGDGFSAVCILGTLRRWSMMKTLARANSFAAAICEIRGAVPENADFYKPFIKEWSV